MVSLLPFGGVQMKGNAWTDQETDLLRKVYGTLPAKQLVEKYFPDRTNIALHKYAKKRGFKSDRRKMTSIAKKEYSANSLYFNLLNSECCYWAGFIAADGSIEKRSNALKIELSTVDKNHLEKFRKAIEFTGKVYTYDKSSVLNIYGEPQILDDLATHFNIVPNKTHILEPPVLTSEDHIRSFIRGYIDGDGSISLVSANSTWRLSVVGRQSMMKWIGERIACFVGIQYSGIYSDRNCFQLVYGGSRQSIRVLDWLYRNAHSDIMLNRKFEKYIKLKERCSAIDASKSSQYRGVSYNSEKNSWDAKIHQYNKKIWIGRFNTETEAAKAYDLKAKELGLYERCNFS